MLRQSEGLAQGAFSEWQGKEEAGKGLAGELNPAWKGGLTYFKRKGKYQDQSIKYVRCPEAFMSMARKDGYVMEHRLAVAMTIGRPLTRKECVHHINHDATDNRIENLMLFASNADHKRFEHGQDIKPLWRPDLVLSTMTDVGSGSTGKAAVSEGFNFTGIELSEEFFEIAKARIAHAVANQDADQDDESDDQPEEIVVQSEHRTTLEDLFD